MIDWVVARLSHGTGQQRKPGIATAPARLAGMQAARNAAIVPAKAVVAEALLDGLDAPRPVFGRKAAKR